MNLFFGSNDYRCHDTWLQKKVTQFIVSTNQYKKLAKAHTALLDDNNKLAILRYNVLISLQDIKKGDDAAIIFESPELLNAYNKLLESTK